MADEMNRENPLELMIGLEDSAAAFYDLCAGKFPGRRDFWSSLADAERKHAAFLRDLAFRPEDAAGFAERRRITLDALQRAKADLRRKHETVRTTALSLVQALRLAQSIENSVMEISVLRPVQGDPDDIVQAIRRINQETHSHVVQIDSALAELEQ